MIPRPFPSRRWLALGILAMAAGACSGGAVHQPVGASSTDSAGVTVVSSPAAMDTVEHWSLAPDPEVSIGTVDGAAPYQLFRVVGAVRLSNGDMVVANQGTEELRWYDADGTYLFSHGGSGEGPGEYRGLFGILTVAGDSVLAYDGLAGTMHLYSAAGDLVRSWKIGAVGHSNTPAPFARLADGTFVAVTQRYLTEPPGYVRFEMSVVRYRDGEVLDTLATVPGGGSYFTVCGPNNQAICNWGVPYGVGGHAAAQGERILTGNGDGYVIDVHDPEGRLTAIYRRDVPRRPLTPALRSRYVDSVVARTSEARRPRVRKALSEAPAPDSLPSFTDLRMDPLGDTWVALPDTASDGGSAWDVLGPDGAYLTTVSVPQGLRITQIGEGFLVGIARDEHGVERVEVYRITKGA